ncbi:MAG: peptide deformylase [Candidatus Algichlamydia australiensis]|nr:peptide deformylase [Chlamydiales bacterium]
MAERPLCYYGNPVLRERCKPVEEFNEEIRQVIDDLLDTIAHLDTQPRVNAVGLAAPQIGYTWRIFLTHVPVEDKSGKWHRGEVKVYVNPKILSYSEEEKSWDEGCFSIPRLYAEVFRPQEIKIEAMDRDGNIFQETLTEFAACNFCHEHDHINGVLFIDRISNSDKKRLKPLLKKLKKKYSSNP